MNGCRKAAVGKLRMCRGHAGLPKKKSASKRAQQDQMEQGNMMAADGLMKNDHVETRLTYDEMMTTTRTKNEDGTTLSEKINIATAVTSNNCSEGIPPSPPRLSNAPPGFVISAADHHLMTPFPLGRC